MTADTYDRFTHIRGADEGWGGGNDMPVVFTSYPVVCSATDPSAGRWHLVPLSQRQVDKENKATSSMVGGWVSSDSVFYLNGLSQRHVEGK